jgi:hypothetical protein
MYIIEIFLPLHDNVGTAFPSSVFTQIRLELANRFGGVTAFVRSPAVGIWKDDEGIARRDDIVVFEVMADDVDEGWWTSYRRRLEEAFRQDEVLIRATSAQRL